LPRAARTGVGGDPARAAVQAAGLDPVIRVGDHAAHEQTIPISN
jgi:hypothetical protein